jgi:hypothetical protein
MEKDSLDSEDDRHRMDFCQCKAYDGEVEEDIEGPDEVSKHLDENFVVERCLEHVHAHRNIHPCDLYVLPQDAMHLQWACRKVDYGVLTLIFFRHWQRRRDSSEKVPRAAWQELQTWDFP